MLQNSCCLIWEQKMGQTGSLPWQSASNLALLPQEYAYPPAPPPDPPLYPFNHNAVVLAVLAGSSASAAHSAIRTCIPIWLVFLETK